MKIAIFPGSFDPITNGHMDIVKQAAEMFDRIYLVVMTNTHKKYLFSAAKRAALAAAAVQQLPNVSVLKRPTSLTVAVARQVHAQTIIRGVRDSADFLYEQQIAGMNRQLAPDIHTALLFTSPENSFVASSMIKEVAKFQGPVTRFLPAASARALRERMNEHA